MSGPVAISLYPAKQDTKDGHARVTITNSSHQPLEVKTSTVLLHNKCAQTATTGVTVKHSFVLDAGKSLSVPITIHHVSGDIGVVFAATPKHVHGFTQSDALGAQILTSGASSCVPSVPHKPVAEVKTSSGINPVFIALIALAVVAIAAAFTYSIYRNRRSGGHRAR